MLCTYTGNDQRHYLDYRDATTGRVLEVSPGGVYDVEVASGQAAGLPLPPGDGRWVPAFVPEVKAPVLAGLPPVLAAMAVASVTPEEAGDSPAEVES